MSPGQRAIAELARDPARSDALIALAAACTTRTVQRCRRALERRGVIEPVPSGQRQHAWAAWPSRNPGATARVRQQLAADPHRPARAIAEAARCTPQTVWVALRAIAPGGGHTDGMGNKPGARLIIKPDDPHAPAGATEAATRTPPRYVIEPDEIEWLCCTAEWRDGRFTHERSCVMRRAG